MTTYCVRRDGNDAADGLSHATAWKTLDRLQQHASESAAPGDVYWLRAGESFDGSLGSGMPDLTLATYDGDAPATIHSGVHNGLEWWGTSGLTVRGIRFVGDGPASPETAAGVYVSGQRGTRGVRLVDVEATGYGLAGTVLEGIMEDVEVVRARLHHNANGLHVSGFLSPVPADHVYDPLRPLSLDGTSGVVGLKVRDTEASDNALFNRMCCGYGLHLVGAQNVEIAGCRMRKNGNVGTPGDGVTFGHGGVLLWRCRQAVVRHCHTEDTTDPTGLDGQGICTDDSEDMLIEYCTALRDREGFRVHSEREFVSRRVVIRHNIATDCVSGLSAFAHDGDVWFQDNDVSCHGRDGRFRKCVDIWDVNGLTHFAGNRIAAHDGALLLQADGPAGLRHARFAASNVWDAPHPAFVVRGRWHTSLAAALAAEPART